jgi:DNA-binding transcriptional LysR family regulator
MVFIRCMRDIHASEVDLNLLVALDALVQERSVSRAASRLGLTQSAMSHRLRRLRERFDDELLVGGRGGMVPTPRAQELAAPIRRGLLELGEVLRQPEAFDPATSTRTFTYVSKDYAEIVVVPRMLERVGKEAPNIDVMFKNPDERTLERLANGEADFYVGLPIPDADLVRLPAGKDDFVAVVRDDHPDVGRTLSLEAYVKLGHVLVADRDGPSFVDEMLQRLGIVRRIVLRIGRFAGAPFVVSRSNLVATLPRAVAVTSARYMPLRLLELPIDLPAIPIEVMWHARNNQDPGHRWLRTITAETTRAAIEDVSIPARTSGVRTKRARARRAR